MRKAIAKRGLPKKVIAEGCCRWFVIGSSPVKLHDLWVKASRQCGVVVLTDSVLAKATNTMFYAGITGLLNRGNC